MKKDLIEELEILEVGLFVCVCSFLVEGGIVEVILDGVNCEKWLE